MSELRFREVQSAEMKPDCHAGDTFDAIAPRWEGEGDKGDVDTFHVMMLKALRYPPGTRVTVEVPVCPHCNVFDADIALNYDTGEMGKCECGFDWQAWTRERYG